MKTAKQLRIELKALLYGQYGSEVSQKELMESLQKDIRVSCYGYFIAGGIFACILISFISLCQR